MAPLIVLQSVPFGIATRVCISVHIRTNYIYANAHYRYIGRCIQLFIFVIVIVVIWLVVLVFTGIH